MKKWLLISSVAIIIFAAVLIALVDYFVHGPSEENTSVELYLQSQELIQKGEVHEAERVLQKAMKMDSQNSYYLKFEMGKIKELQKDYRQALENYEAAAKLNPEETEVNLRAARMAKKLGKNKKALHFYEQANKYDPKNISILYQLGYYYTMERRLDMAEDTYKKILSISYDETEAYRNLAFIYAEEGDLDKAVRTLKRAIELKKRYPEAYNDLGNIMMIKNEYKKAVEMYEQALQIKPDYEDARKNLERAKRRREAESQ